MKTIFICFLFLTSCSGLGRLMIVEKEVQGNPEEVILKIYTRQNKVYISYMNLNLMKHFFESDTSLIMEKVNKDIESIVSL